MLKETAYNVNGSTRNSTGKTELDLKHDVRNALVMLTTYSKLKPPSANVRS